jgi:1,4-dihydroxy-6-naphthoate synthase
MVVAREPLPVDALRKKTIAIPGTLTTAYLALRLALGEVRTETIAFDAIPRVVSDGTFDAGLLIHEGQLTYASAGLERILDLGAWWKQTTGLPLPLGVNGIRKDLGMDLMRRVSGILRASIEHGLAHRAPAVAHALAWARDMDASLADRFVGMYVNDFTLDLGDRGRRGVELLLARAFEAGITPRPVTLELVA